MTAPTELSDLFAAERAVRPSVDVAERGLARLVEGLAPPAAVPAAGAAKLGVVTISKWILGGLVLGLTGSGMATALLEPGARSSTERPEAHGAVPQTPPQPEPVVPPPASAPPGDPAPRLRTSAEAPEKAAPPRAISALSPALTPPASTPRETFDAELRLINAAKVELDAGRPHVARVWLDEHAARYPAGVFTTDREALRVLGACAERRDPARAEQFVATHPTSPLCERLKHACEATNSK